MSRWPRNEVQHCVRVLVVAQLLGACGLAAGGHGGALLAEHLTGSPPAWPRVRRKR